MHVFITIPRRLELWLIIQKDFFVDTHELVLINALSRFSVCLQTVLENNTPASPGDDDFELWDQNQMLRSENEYK